MHVAMVRSGTCIRALRVEPIDLVLKRRVGLRVRQQAMEYADESTRYGLRRGPHRDDAIVEEMAPWRPLARKVFVVLSPSEP